MNRRDWMIRTSTLALGGALSGSHGLSRADERPLPKPTPSKLPRWRGFNLLSMFNVGNQEAFPEEDFAFIAELGFNFARLPLDYRCWSSANDWTMINERALEPIDRAIAYGEKYGVHVQINFHRTPGFTVASPPEPRSLWSDSEALEASTRHWSVFARRYQGIPNQILDFNLFNEPTDKVTPGDHRRVVEHVVEAIRDIDPNRLIVCDGRRWANEPPTELLGLGVAAALHGYEPMPVTHYQASWVNWDESWPAPAWPIDLEGTHWDRNALFERKVKPWKALEEQGMGVMVGEFGCYNKTPHDVVLAWMRDSLDVYREAGWGWAVWNLRGSFGILDSHRDDVRYEHWNGHQLDREMVALLQSS